MTTIQIEPIFSGDSNWILRGIRLSSDRDTEIQTLSLLLACDLSYSVKEYHAWELSDVLDNVPRLSDRVLKVDFDLENEVVEAEITLSASTLVQFAYGDRVLMQMNTYPDDYIDREYAMVIKTVADAEDFLQQDSDFGQDFGSALDERLSYLLANPD